MPNISSLYFLWHERLRLWCGNGKGKCVSDLHPRTVSCLCVWHPGGQYPCFCCLCCPLQCICGYKNRSLVIRGHSRFHIPYTTKTKTRLDSCTIIYQQKALLFSEQCFSVCLCTPHLEVLLESRLLNFILTVSDSAGLNGTWKICISIKFPCAAAAASCRVALGQQWHRACDKGLMFLYFVHL